MQGNEQQQHETPADVYRIFYADLLAYWEDELTGSYCSGRITFDLRTVTSFNKTDIDEINEKHLVFVNTCYGTDFIVACKYTVFRQKHCKAWAKNMQPVTPIIIQGSGNPPPFTINKE